MAGYVLIAYQPRFCPQYRSLEPGHIDANSLFTQRFVNSAIPGPLAGGNDLAPITWGRSDRKAQGLIGDA